MPLKQTRRFTVVLCMCVHGKFHKNLTSSWWNVDEKHFFFFQLFAFHYMLLFSLILSLNGFPTPFIIPTSISYLYAEELLCVGRSFLNNYQQCLRKKVGLQTRVWSSVGPSPQVCCLIMCISSHWERRLIFQWGNSSASLLFKGKC